jgi:hypothetical protein
MQALRAATAMSDKSILGQHETRVAYADGWNYGRGDFSKCTWWFRPWNSCERYDHVTRFSVLPEAVGVQTYMKQGWNSFVRMGCMKFQLWDIVQSSPGGLCSLGTAAASGAIGATTAFTPAAAAGGALSGLIGLVGAFCPSFAN